MAISTQFDSNFPTLMLARLVALARKGHVGAQFCNTQVTAEIKNKGETITFNTPDDITVADTDDDTSMTYVESDTTGENLTITLDKTAAVRINDRSVIASESGMTLVNTFADRMIYALNDTVDVLVMGSYTQMTTNNYETGTNLEMGCQSHSRRNLDVLRVGQQGYGRSEFARCGPVHRPPESRHSGHSDPARGSGHESG